jgi:hypothetical protein
MNKHTPGPWNCNRASAAGREIIVSEVSPVDVAVLSHRDKSQSEINANARLIAAAPDLLEALEWCAETLAVFVADGSAAPESVIGKNLTTARAAIAKATGETT